MRCDVAAGLGRLPRSRVKGAAAAFGLTVLLAACGGGGGSSSPPPTQAPAAIAAQDDALAVAWSNGAAQTATVDVLANDGAPADATVTVTTPPKHGKAVVAGGKVQYTPDDGYVGADSFDYRVDAGARTGSASARLTVEASFTVSGVVSPPLATGYTVSAQAGAASAVQVQPASERYSVALKVSDLAGLLTVTATGAGEQKHVVIKSLVGEVAALAKQGGTIDEQRRPALRLDVFSVARTGLLQRAGAQPTTDAGLADANRRVSDFDVLGMVGTLRNAMADPSVLPATHPTVADIAADPMALARAMQAARAKDTTARDWTFESSLKAQPVPTAPKIDAQGGLFAFIDAHKPSDVEDDNSSVTPNLTKLLDLRADGTVGAAPGSKAAGTWTRSGGKVVITANPNTWALGGYFTGYGWASRSVTGYELEELPRAGVGGQALFTLKVLYSTESCSDMRRTCHTSYGGSKSATVVGIDVARDLLPFQPAQFAAGARLVGLSPKVPTEPNGYCQACRAGITLEGSPSVIGLTGAITADGRWTLSGAGFSTRYTRLLRYGNGVETWLAEYQDNGVVTNASLFEVAGGSASGVTIADDLKARRWLDMPPGTPVPLDWSLDEPFPRDVVAFPWYSFRLLNVPPAATGAAPAVWRWSDDGITLSSSYTDSYTLETEVYTYRLLSKTRDGYLVSFTAAGYPAELRVWVDAGAAR